jgi:hypothetical protein
MLAGSADHSSYDFSNKTNDWRRRCKLALEVDRNMFAQEAHGYKVHLHKLDPLECSPKNDLLVGLPPVEEAVD